MKKFLALMIALTALFTATAQAVSPNEILNEFLGYTDVRWEHNKTYDGDTFEITETAVLDGFPYTFGICGVDNQVSQVYFSGWFADMEMLDQGEFSDGLFAYTDCEYACRNFLPDDMEFDEIFSPYDIYPAVLEGDQSYISGTNWLLLDTQPGDLAARHEGPYLVEAERLSDGRFWFTVMFP